MKWMYAFLLAFVVINFVGCSKDNDTSTTPIVEKGALKVTVTTSASYNQDGGQNYIKVGTSAANNKGVFQKWKINNVDGSDGQVLYSIEGAYFNGGKTAVLETGANYLTANINLSAFANTKPFLISYKIEQGGKTIVEKTVDIKLGESAWSLSFNY